MPTTVNAARPRKVRCPKCTALLTEPQTQIYKCPICSTLLLAKGNSGGSSGRSSEISRLQGNSRDAEDIQQTAEGGSKLEKGRLIHESGKEKLLQGMDHVKKEGKPFEESDGPSRSDSLYESTDTVSKFPPEGDLSSDLDDQPLSRRTFLSQRTHPSDDLVPKINVSSFEMPPYPPHRRKASYHSSGSGENSDKSEEGDRFSELDSASHTESEVDMDSSVWSSENANASGVLEVMPSASKTEGSSLIESSGERFSPLVPSQSSEIISNLEVVGDGAYMQQEESEIISNLEVVGDGAYMQQEESEHAERHQFGVWSRDGGTEEEAVHVERHQSWSPDGATSDEVPEVERGLEVDYRTGNEEESEMTISSRESFLDEGYTLSDQNHPEVADNKEIDKLHCSSIEVKDEEVANTGDIERLHCNLVESRFKNETFDDSRHPLSDEVSIEVADDKHVGKVQSSLFDLSVFGIYDENTYLEMRRGKEAHYSTLSGNDSQGHSRFDGEIVSEEHPHESATQNTFSAEQDCAKDDMHQDITGIWKQSSVLDVPESEIESTCTKTGLYSEMPLEASQHDSDVRSSLSVEQEVNEGGDRNLGDAGLWSVATGDKDDLLNARYGGALSEKDLSSEVLSSIDMSFGDWQSQQVVKPHEALEQKHMEADLVDEERILNSDTGDPTDSSWEDNEDLTFSSTPKDSKLEQTTLMDKDTQDFSGTSKSSGMFLARRNEVFSEKPAFPLRTVAMQMFLRRTLQEGTAQTQVQQKVMESEANIYEAPYVDHYVPPREEKDLEATDQASALASEKNLHEAPHAEQHEPHDVMSMMANTDPLDGERPVFETEKESSLDAHLAMRHTPLSWNEEAAMNVRSVMEDVHSRKEFDSERGQHRDATEDKMDQRDMERLVSDTQKAENLNVQHLPLKKLGNAARKPISLGWKGKVVTDTQAPSSMEDLRGHKMEFAPGRERDAAVIQGTGLTEEHSFSGKGGKQGSGQWPRSHGQPENRVFSSQRTRMTDDNVKFRERQKHESGDHVGPDRAAWHRPSKGSLSDSDSFKQIHVGPDRAAWHRPSKGSLSNSDSFKQSDMLHMKGRFSNSDSFGQSGADRREHASALQGQALHPNRSVMDQGSSYFFNGATHYNSDHSARSQEVLSHPQFNTDPHGLAVPSNRAYPFPVSSHGSMAPAFLQEHGFTHSAHHCVSPVCPLCIQQQYHMQQPPMLQNMMMHPCAACVSQPPGAAYKPILHDPHAHHMQLSSYSNPSLRQRESGLPPAQSRRQNRSNSHLNYPTAAAKKTKLYPPLPWKGAPPYVLCKDCNQMLKVPAYLPPNKKPIQKLRCGACGKVSKFSVPTQANSQSFSKSSWQPTSGSAMNAYQFSNSSARDQRYTDTASVHSSEQISSLGPGTRQSASTQNLAGMARYGSAIHSQQEWVENQMLQETNAATIADSDMDSADHGYHPALAGGVLGLGHFRSQVRYSEGVSDHNNAVVYSEGYLSSSPSSASGSSPGIRYQLSGQQQKVEAMRREGAVFGERKMSHDLLARPTMYEQDGPPFEAPSFSDGFFQKDSNEGRSRFSSTSLQGSLQDPFNESPRNDHERRHQPTSRAGSWQNQLADADFSKSSSRSSTAQLRKMPVAPGSPLIEHFTEDAEEVGPSLHQRHLLQASGNGSRSAPWTPATGSPLFDHLTYDASSDFSERSRERELPPPSTQDMSKGPKYYAGLLKRSLKDLGKGGQASNNRRKVVVNGHLITEAAVRKAEEQAGTIHPGSYWYDYKAGFWGAMGGPCLGILLPFIEEFNFPLARDCAGGTTGILVNGRELHEKDLEVLAKRGLSKISGKAYIVDINGKVFDDASGRQLKGLGRLAPSIEKKGRGCGMFQPAAQP